MHQLQSHSKRPGENAGLIFNWVYLLASSHATCFLVFFRSGFGTHAFGLNGLFALVMILVYGAAAEAPEMFGFLLLWLTFLVVRRAESLSLSRRGLIRHSRYSGRPWLAMWLPLVRREGTATGLVEPLLCFVTGAFLMPVSQPLGTFVLVGTFTLMFKDCTEREIDRARLRAMRDAQFENQHLVERFHGRTDGF